MISRLGLLGGMFDPVHKGHVAAARYARDLLQLDCVKMLPCNLPNHRAAGNASADHRLAMLQLALEGEASIEADALELERGGISYSVDTVLHYHHQSDSTQLVFILGMDAMNAIDQWHRWQEMFDHSHFLVLGREAKQLEQSTRDSIRFDARRVDSAADLFSRASGAIYVAREFDFDASSTSVRDALASKASIENLLPPNVHNYIEKHKLYCD